MKFTMNPFTLINYIKELYFRALVKSAFAR